MIWRLVRGFALFVVWLLIAALNVCVPFLYDYPFNVQVAAGVALVALDAGAVGFMVGGLSLWADRQRVIAVMAFLVALAFSALEVMGAVHTAKHLTGMLSAPERQAEDARKGAQSDLDSETSNLAEIRKQLATERRETRLEDLHKRETAAIKRIGELRPKTYASSVEAKPNLLAGYELPIVCTFWLVLQLGTIAATGSLHGVKLRGKSTEERTEADSVRGQGVRSGQCVREDSQHGVREGGEPPLSERAASDVKTDSKAIDFEQNGQSGQAENGQGGQGVRSVPKGRPVLGLVPKDEFADEVLKLTNEGLSVRQIMTRLGCGRTKVNDAQKKLREKGLVATSSRA